jgi:hypothetical protein
MKLYYPEQKKKSGAVHIQGKGIWTVHMSAFCNIATILDVWGDGQNDAESENEDVATAEVSPVRNLVFCASFAAHFCV